MFYAHEQITDVRKTVSNIIRVPRRGNETTRTSAKLANQECPVTGVVVYTASYVCARVFSFMMAPADEGVCACAPNLMNN